MAADAPPAPTAPAPVTIARDLLLAIYREARAAFPAECCGWLTSPRDQPGQASAMRACRNAQGAGDHPTAPERGAETAYVIAGDDLLAFARSFDGAEPARVIFHSHPNGRAYFSATDRQVALSPWGDGPTYPVQQLVVGIDGERVVEAALFGWSDAAGDFVELARLEGAPL
ncbi:MAG: Mov34/MPN/PAD-1 family protein [Kofleriaceae bacterium]|nr:Mov34/MPN/PAD-1 family protein [Myxococcales bacterium]MCB9563921.1 Mov34/MPN/PAD-1 family protein [Kofleriaceae bacterium]